MRRRRGDATYRYRPFDLPGMTPVEACRALVEASALTWAELLALELAADPATAPDDRPLDLDPDAAGALLDRWRGPTPGLRWRPLPHWGTAAVRGGVPFDPARRSRAGSGNPFTLDAEEDHP